MIRVIKLMVTGAVGYLLYKLVTDVTSGEFAPSRTGSKGQSQPQSKAGPQGLIVPQWPVF